MESGTYIHGTHSWRILLTLPTATFPPTQQEGCEGSEISLKILYYFPLNLENNIPGFGLSLWTISNSIIVYLHIV